MLSDITVARMVLKITKIKIRKNSFLITACATLERIIFLNQNFLKLMADFNTEKSHFLFLVLQCMKAADSIPQCFI